MEHFGVSLDVADDEILLPEKIDEVLTMVAIKGGRCLLKIMYGTIDMIDDKDAPEPVRAFWISGGA